jgi:hypothetical protein
LGGVKLEGTNDEKTKLLWLAKRLADVAEEINALNDEQKKMVIERADNRETWNLKALYESLDEYMGW